MALTLNPTVLPTKTVLLEILGFVILSLILISGFASFKSVLILENTLLVLPTGGIFIGLIVFGYKIVDFLFKGHLVKSLLNKIKKITDSIDPCSRVLPLEHEPFRVCIESA